MALRLRREYFSSLLSWSCRKKHHDLCCLTLQWKTVGDSASLNFFDWTSDYGFSILRPLSRLIIAPALACLLLYYLLLALANSGLIYAPLLDRPDLANKLLQFTFANMAPLPDTGLLKDLRGSLFGQASVTSTLALLIEILQRLLALVGYFLTGLAIRNLIKMK